MVTRLLHQISIWIILLPLITGLWFSKKLSHKSLIILLLVIVATPPQLSSDFFPEKLSNVLYNIYTPIEFFILYYFFKDRIYSNIGKKVFKSSFITYFVTSTVILAIQQNIEARFISEWVTVNNLIYLFWIVVYFRDQLLLPQMELSFNEPFIWCLLGIFIYASCTSLHFILYETIQNSYLKIFQSSFNILLYVLFTISLIKDEKLKTEN